MFCCLLHSSLSVLVWSLCTVKTVQLFDDRRQRWPQAQHSPTLIVASLEADPPHLLSMMHPPTSVVLFTLYIPGLQTDIFVVHGPFCIRHIFQQPFDSLLSIKGASFVQVLAALFLSLSASTAALFSERSLSEPQGICLSLTCWPQLWGKSHN